MIRKYENAHGRLSDSQREGFFQLLNAINDDQDVTEIPARAYMLATVKHECADTWLPIREYGRGAGRPYGAAVNIVDNAGNTYTNAYYGRGYVQLTWEENYQKMSFDLGMGERLWTHPEDALNPDTAYRIMSRGMRNGSFTGKSLSDYINEDGVDYFNARRVINGTDRAELIAGYAREFEGMLRDCQGTLVVVEGAELKCNNGDKRSQLTLIECRGKVIGGRGVCTVFDHYSGTNILPFGNCALTGAPCSPTTPSLWAPSGLSMVLGDSPLLVDSASLGCVVGGHIIIEDPGQDTVKLPPE